MPTAQPNALVKVGYLQLGPNTTAAARATAWGCPALIIANGVGLPGGDANILLTSNAVVDGTYGSGVDGGPNRQTGIGVTDGASLGRERHCFIASGSDGGFRFWSNTKVSAGGQVSGDTNYGRILESHETNGAWSLQYSQPEVLGSNSWTSGGGKHIAIFPGGWNSGASYEMGEFTDICSFHALRGIQILTSATTNAGVVMARFKGDGGANPVSLYVGGSLKNVTVDGSGFLKAV